MKTNNQVTPSSQVDSFVPTYVYENYSEFVNFMQKSSESEERIGFGQDILQNLQKYRDFDYYNDEIVQYGVLNSNVSKTDDELVLVDGFGFPDQNGVILIDDEVILYRTKEGNTLQGLQRGAAGTTVLPTLRSSSTYVETVATSHNKGSEVQNLSVMFLVAMLDNIHQSFTPNIDSSRISPEVNRSSLLQNIRDFFASKGSSLGIRALFKMLFNQNDVKVTYPGDRMVKPSDSTWVESLILRTVPMSEILADPTKEYVTPEKLLGTNLKLKDYRDGSVLATVYSDYISTYPFESTIQYEFLLDKDSIDGNIISNPSTTLTRQLNIFGGSDDRSDVTTVTVESTVGFPDSGIIFIESEGIEYTSKTFNQFLGCTRGKVSVEKQHETGVDVYGPYYIQTESTNDDGVTEASFSFPIGLVTKVDVIDGGLLQLTSDSITPGDPGRTDPGNLVINSFIENYDDDLVTQEVGPPSLGYVSNYTQGVSGVYFDDEFTYVPSTNLPGYELEPFSTDDSVGSLLQGENAVHVIPNRDSIKPNTENTKKGTDIVGVAVDGVPFYSNVSKDQQVYGKILRFNVKKGGSGYVNPNVIVGADTQASVTLTNGSVTDVDLLFSGEYESQPEVIIADGIGAKIDLAFDNYGRITSATVSNQGQSYNTTPYIRVYDSSNRGKGALLTSTISAGSLISVEIQNSGIDYNPSTTTAEVVSVGLGAEVEAVCESYTFDEYTRIRLNANTDLDSSNAYLFMDADGNNSKFAYMANPVALRDSLGDDGSAHSPIIGWAVDGNPIYGPYGFTNGVDSTGGVQEQSTGYYLPNDRTNVIPANSTVPSENPPPVSLYPMGTFVEDYVFDQVEAAIFSGKILTDPNRDFLETEIDEDINYTAPTASVIGINNGKICNTPDFPADRYPNGVFVYFLTTFGNVGSFPYTVGPIFKNRPQSQNVRLLNNGVEIETDKPESSYDDTVIEVDFTNTKRLRNPYLSSTKEELEVEIDAASGTLSGSIDTITAEDGTIANIAVDDLLYFDNTGTDGTGAAARVTHVTTASGTIVPSDPQSAKAGGFEIMTRLYSHKQRIDLSDITPSTSYTFPITYNFVTDSGSSAFVDSYDPISKVLEVTVASWRLIKYGDTFKDARGRSITLPTNVVANETVFDSDTVGATSTHMAYTDPTSNESEPGDLWWSGDNGRLYIYYNDGDTSQWVSAFPLGMRSFSTSVSLNVPESLDLNFAENKSLIDNVSGNNLITFTRASTGTYVDDSGVIQTASDDTPRFDHDPVTLESLGLLIEEERTNYFTNSTPVSIGWSQYNGSSITDNQATGPDGVTNSASLVTFPATGGAVPIIGASSAGVSGTVTVSMYVRAVTGTVSLQVGTNVAYGTTQIVGTSWTRIQFTTASLGSSAGLRSGDVNSVQNFYAWGAQVEEGSFPTSYIPTTSSAVTRAADVASITGTNFSSWYNQSEGSFFIDFNGLQTVGSSRIIGTNANPTPIYWNGSKIRSYGLNVGPIITGDDSIPNKAALSYSTTIPEDTLCINGTSASTATGFNTASNATTAIYLFASNAAVNTVGHISRLSYFPTRKSDTELIQMTGGTVPANVSNAHSGSTIAISDIAPSRRTDGSANVRGDLWWSTRTGMLYIYSSDNPSLAGNTGEYDWSSEWVCTDPTGMISMEGSSNEYEYQTISAGGGPDYEDNVRVVISDTSPTTLPGGGAITMGTLWWSPINGKMYIYYTDADSSQWVITNPAGTLSGEYSLNSLIVGDASGVIDTLSILPEPTNSTSLWLESLDNIFVGDVLQTESGAPESGDFDNFTVLEIKNEHQIEVLRDDNPIEISHGAVVTNTSRYIYRIVTDGKNGLKPGIEIEIESPLNPGLDGTHLVDTVGNVTVPTASATISGGAVTGVTVLTPGANYTEDFYVYFVGGGGVGAYGYASVAAIDDGGGVISVEVLEGGVNYTTNPAVIFDATDSDESFTLYTDELYLPDPNLTFETTDKLIQNYTTTYASRLELISGGLGYKSLPLVIGAYHKSDDRAETKISLDGTTIGSVEVKYGGNRYSAPIAKFTDTTGSGSGATADVIVVDGEITAITITDAGTGYVEPVLELVEPGGVFSMTTKDIGRIVSVYVTDPGRNISSERSLAPELIVDIRLVFTRVSGYTALFNIGDEIYQGSPDSKSATATIVSYDTNRQILKLDNVAGKFIENEMVYGTTGVGGMVTLVGQADLRINVGGASEVNGRFITDKSMVSESFPVIQDSYRYQWFSYDIASPLQQVQYDTFVQDIVHPAGFIRFSTVAINESIECPFFTEDPIIVLQGDLSSRAFGSTPILITNEGSVVITTEKDEIVAGEQFP